MRQLCWTKGRKGGRTSTKQALPLLAAAAAAEAVALELTEVTILKKLTGTTPMMMTMMTMMTKRKYRSEHNKQRYPVVLTNSTVALAKPTPAMSHQVATDSMLVEPSVAAVPAAPAPPVPPVPPAAAPPAVLDITAMVPREREVCWPPSQLRLW